MLLERLRISGQPARTQSRLRLRHRLIAPGPGAVALVIMLVAAYFIFRGPQWNADSHLYLTVSIVDRGTLNIDPFAPSTGDKAAAHGHFYTDKEPGLSFLAVPVYAAIRLALLHGHPYIQARDVLDAGDMWVRYLLAVVFAAVPTGLIAALIYKLLGRMGVGRGWCAALALTYGLGTIARPFAGLFFSHQLATLLCFAAFFLLFRIRRRELDHRYALAAGLLLGYALITELPTAIIVAGLSIYAIAIPMVGTRVARWAGLGMAPPLALGALYHLLAFGSPFGLGYDHLAGPEIYRQGQAQGFFGVTYPHLDAIWGTTFSPYRGLFFLSPILLLAIPGCMALVRRIGWRDEALLCAWVGVAYTLFNWSYFAWDGGGSTGPRQILPSLPFLVVPIGALLLPSQMRRWRVAAGVLAGYSIALVELYAAVAPAFDEHMIAPLTQQVLPRLAGLQPDFTHAWGPARLWGALVHAVPLFLSARLEYNWGQLPNWPGLTQLYPLALVITLILLWSTLRVRLFPWLLPRLHAGLRALLAAAAIAGL